jgi:uncharacterized Zn finger protein
MAAGSNGVFAGTGQQGLKLNGWALSYSGPLNPLTMTPTPPNDLLDRPLLRQLAGDDRFRSGEEYFNDGRVRQVHVAGDRITAKVSGTRAYRVKLWRGRGELLFSCNCSLGREGTFCKHSVAVGLAWLAGPEGQSGAPGVTREQLRDHLRALEKERLVELALEAMEYDDILRRRLMLETIGVSRGRKGSLPPAAAPEPNLAVYRQILREAIECPDYVDYDAMPDYAQSVEEAVRPLGELLRGGHASTVMELAEFAIIELDKASEMLDGGDGSLNTVYDDLQHYHLEACRLARPDPEQLAARLLHYEIEGGMGVFNNTLSAYADALGPQGIEAWRRLLVQEWASLPELNAASKKKSSRKSINHRRFQITALMERMVAEEGDLETLAVIKQRDLSSAHDFLSLAELYQRAGQPKQAMLWAERGLKTFPAAAENAGLRDFLADAYRQMGRNEEAVALVWEEFTKANDLESYRRLQSFAQDGADGGSWEHWRTRALDHLRQRAAQRDKAAHEHRWSAPADHSLLVTILLSERRDDEAWAEASAGGCRPYLWLQLAARREKTHPADALRVYQEQIGPLIARGDQRAYREAIDLLGRIRALLAGLGRAEEFGVYSAEVRAAHRQKRTFLKLLDAMR